MLKLKRHYLNSECERDCPCLYIRDEAERVRLRLEAEATRAVAAAARVAAVVGGGDAVDDAVNSEVADLSNTGDVDVDLTLDDMQYIDFRDAKRKSASAKFFFDLSTTNPDHERDSKIYARLCATVDLACTNAERYAHPFNTCGVERFHGERAANSDKRLYYARSYIGRTYWTAAKRLVGWNALLLLLTRLGIMISMAVQLRVDRLNQQRQIAYNRKRSAAFGKVRAALAVAARRQNDVRKRIAASSKFGYEYKVGKNKRYQIIFYMSQT